jgi:hypothetical protein
MTNDSRVSGQANALTGSEVFWSNTADQVFKSGDFSTITPKLPLGPAITRCSGKANPSSAMKHEMKLAEHQSRMCSRQRTDVMIARPLKLLGV